MKVCLHPVYRPPVGLQAWEDTYTKWDQVTKQILNFPKNKAEDGQVSPLLIIYKYISTF